MTIPIRGIGAVMAAGFLFTGACASDGVSDGPMRPAVLTSWDAGTMAKVKTVLADAMGKASVDLGPGDPTKTSTISILPPRPTPHETMSMATPTQFDLMMKGGRCFVVRRDTGKAYELGGVSCRVMAQ